MHFSLCLVSHLIYQNHGEPSIFWDTHCDTKRTLNEIVIWYFDYVFNWMNVLEQIVTDYAKDRPIIFSTFQPDAAVLVRKLQSTYPVSFRLFFLLC
jgi:hypothetical protein